MSMFRSNQRRSNGNRSRRNEQRNRKRPNPLGASRFVDYLDAKALQRFVNDQGRILPRRITGASSLQQRRIAEAVKHARHLAIMPFVAHDVN
jgi:small subunit ribosomal protein S18